MFHGTRLSVKWKYQPVLAMPHHLNHQMSTISMCQRSRKIRNLATKHQQQLIGEGALPQLVALLDESRGARTNLQAAAALRNVGVKNHAAGEAVSQTNRDPGCAHCSHWGALRWKIKQSGTTDGGSEARGL